MAITLSTPRAIASDRKYIKVYNGDIIGLYTILVQIKRMEPQNSRAGLTVGLALIAGLVVGVLGGYYFGYDIGYEKAVTDASRAAEDSSASVNALGDVETNPLENVRLNPFE